MSMCQLCSMGLSSSCQNPSCGTTDLRVEPQVIPSPTLLGIEITDVHSETEDDSRRSSSRHRSSRKRKGSDSQSAGRKVAARLYPLLGESPCEWQGQANCGGGDFPILGCPEGTGKQQARHHGPDKNVSSNFDGNVHRICHYCHYRWHAANDATYDWNAGVWPLHNPRPMTEKELQLQVLDYMRYESTTKRQKVKVD